LAFNLVRIANYGCSDMFSGVLIYIYATEGMDIIKDVMSSDYVHIQVEYPPRMSVS
jgi:REP element-mobilizing transposase RayT|tara:strand:+ start:6044 stop:6211 length:168 start_codon:yes stop_codon:yes gene_type:complete